MLSNEYSNYTTATSEEHSVVYTRHDHYQKLSLMIVAVVAVEHAHTFSSSARTLGFSVRSGRPDLDIAAASSES
eukprot:8389-Heterococcus_DN1.PRE.1